MPDRKPKISPVADRGAFLELCRRIRSAPSLALDTEFIPERTYTPELCLVQIADDAGATVIDPLAVGDFRAFWEALVAIEGEVVVHAGKQEMEFCFASAGALPRRLVDVQLAAGFAGLGYPLSHANLIFKVLGQTPRSLETRTDWRIRPLSDRQAEYAADDVRYLLAAWRKLRDQLESDGRMEWFLAEQQAMYGSTGEDEGTRWRRVPGAGSLKPRALAVLREVAQWRDERARRLNKPPRWILRDDLVAELAKRQPTTMEELRSTRGLGVDAKATWAKDLLQAIQRGLDATEESLPVQHRKREAPEEQMVVKLLGAALIQHSREVGVATSLVGTNEDLHELLDWHRSGRPAEGLPALMQGWRAEVAGRYLCDLMEGKLVARIIADAEQIQLKFDPLP